MMDRRKKNANVCSQSGEDRFLNSFSQSKSEQFWEPTPKKVKLDVAKNGYPPKSANCITKPVHNNTELSDKNDSADDFLWGDEAEFSDIIAQVDETLAQSQMTQLTQSSEMEIHHEPLVKRQKSDVKNNHRVPLRRVGSSQWPSSTNFSSSHSSNIGNYVNNVATNGKVPNNATFLHTDLEQLRLENKKMKDELNRKTGEARILRDKVNSTEKEKEKIKREFSGKMDTLKAEAERNSSNLLREIRSLKGQLDVKNMEIKTAERRSQMSTSLNRIQPDSPNNRLRTSSRQTLKENVLEFELDRSIMKEKGQRLPLKFIRESVMPELLEPSQSEAPISESVRSSNPRLFSGLFRSSASDQSAGGPSTSKSEFTPRYPAAKRELRAPHTPITPCAALLLSPGLVDIASNKAQQAFSQVVDICHQILTELLKQLESTMCSNHRFVERERELLLSGFKQLPLDQSYDLISHRELFSDERGISARRALGLMSLLVEASDFTAKKILTSSSKETTEILDTVRNIVRQIEKQRRTLMFQGVLAGAAALLRNLLNTEVTISKEIQTLMVDILRWIVIARPGILVIRNILQALLAAARCPHIINSLCHNSAEKTFKENPRHSIVQFTSESCILQVLCSLVKNADTPKKQVLTDLFTLWILSLFCGAKPRPKWLITVPPAKSCQCHSLLCKLSFSLLSEACFTYPSATGGDQRQLEKVLARGVLLMNTIMNEDEHLLAIVDPYSLGCYEHSLHSLGNLVANAKIKLDTNTRDILEILCTQEEVLKQPGNPMNEEQSTLLGKSLESFETGGNGVKCPNLAELLESL